MLQGYLTGQLASASGTYQVEALKREFKSFTEHVEESMRSFKEKTAIEIQTMRGIIFWIISITVINKIWWINASTYSAIFNICYLKMHKTVVLFTQDGERRHAIQMPRQCFQVR